jgi:hypothetical protein
VKVKNETASVPELTLQNSKAKKMFANIQILGDMPIINLVILLTSNANPNSANTPRPFIKNNKNTMKQLMNNDAVFKRLCSLFINFTELIIRPAVKNPNNKAISEKKKLLSNPRFSGILTTGYIRKYRNECGDRMNS